MTSVAFCRGGRPVPSIRVAPRKTITSPKAAWEATIASATGSTVLMIRPPSWPGTAGRTVGVIDLADVERERAAATR